jgi:DNA-binding transcriptional LysR family regulator
MAKEDQAIRAILETPYSNSVCELALRGVGIGMAHPIIGLDYLERGLVMRPLSLDIRFTGLLVFRPGMPLSENAKALLRVMRIQMDADLKAVRHALNKVTHFGLSVSLH